MTKIEDIRIKPDNLTCPHCDNPAFQIVNPYDEDEEIDRWRLGLYCCGCGEEVTGSDREWWDQ